VVTWYETVHWIILSRTLVLFCFVSSNLDELKNTIDDDGDETKSNIPEFIEVK
jgi:hypothetical protein